MTHSQTLKALTAAWLLLPGVMMAQQQDTDNDGICNPDAQHPAFGAVVDYAQFPQLTDVPSMYITVYKTTATMGADGKYTYEVDYSRTMDVSTTKTDWYYQCRIVIADRNGKMKQIDEEVQLRGRGNSTWNWVNSGKRPFRLKFPAKKKLLVNYDMAKGAEVNGSYANAKNWTLMANAFDKTLIHNAFTYELGHNKLTNLPFCPAYRFVDLYVNKQYYGTYQVSDHIQVASDRVAIADDGWFVEVTGAGNGNAFLESPYVQVGSGYANIKNPETETEPGTFAQIRQSLSEYYTACTNKSGYQDKVDLASLIDWTIGEEIAGNFDGTYGNIFHYREAQNDKWHVGPLWDLDIAYGGHDDMARNHVWDHGHGWEAMSNILRSLYGDKTFFKAFYERWQTVYDDGKLNEWAKQKIDELAGIVRQSQAKNFSMARPFNNSTYGINQSDNMGGSFASYDAAISYFKSWVTAHIEWLNGEYSQQYTTLGLDMPTPGPGVIGGLEEVGKNAFFAPNQYGEMLYTFTGSSEMMVVGAPVEIVSTVDNVDLYIGKEMWKDGSSGNKVNSFNLNQEEVNKLAQNGYTFSLVVWDNGTISSVKVSGLSAPAEPEPCSHTYLHGEFAQQADKSFRRVCDLCGEAETDGDVYYQATLYPESDAAEVRYVTASLSWQPSAQKPNSILVVEAPQSVVAQMQGYNIVCGKKNADGNLTCADFRLTDGHPYYSNNKFVAAQAIYTRTLSNRVGTICLPFKQQQATANGVSYYHMASVDASGVLLTAIQPDVEGNASAYVPVVFVAEPGTNVLTVQATDVTVKKSSAEKINIQCEGWTMVGTMESLTFTDVRTDDRLVDEMGQRQQLYFIQDGTFWHGTGRFSSSPFRAYILSTQTLSMPSSAPIRIEDATGIEHIIGTEDVMADEIQISRLLLPLPAGCYQVNGRAVNVK